MAGTRREAAERRRRHIRDVAVEVFARHGFAATTTKLIAREAGVAEGLLFHYFPAKLDLLREVVSAYGGYRLPAEDILAGADLADARTGLTAFAGALLAHLREHADLIAVLAGEAQTDGELSGVFWEVVADMRAHLASWLDRAMAAGSVRLGAPTGTAAAMVTATLSFFFLQHRRLPDEQWDPLAEALVAELVTTTLGGIVQVGPGSRSPGMP